MQNSGAVVKQIKQTLFKMSIWLLKLSHVSTASLTWWLKKCHRQTCCIFIVISWISHWPQNVVSTVVFVSGSRDLSTDVKISLELAKYFFFFFTKGFFLSLAFLCTSGFCDSISISFHDWWLIYQLTSGSYLNSPETFFFSYPKVLLYLAFCALLGFAVQSAFRFWIQFCNSMNPIKPHY
jgi:hypothetical protein